MSKLIRPRQQLRACALTAVLGCSVLSGPVLSDQHTTEEPQPIAWSQLPEDAREALAPFEGRWDNLKPHHQHKLLRRVNEKEFKQGSERWQSLSQAERDRIKESRRRFQHLPPGKRQELRQRWANMSEAERQEAAQARQILRHYPPKQRHLLLEELRKLPPEQRRQELRRLGDAKPASDKQDDPAEDRKPKHKKHKPEQ
jgi:hypothetical protein